MPLDNIDQHVFVSLNQGLAVGLAVSKLLVAVTLDPLLQSGQHSSLFIL